jgi:hypothetical protein
MSRGILRLGEEATPFTISFFHSSTVILDVLKCVKDNNVKFSKLL